MHPSRQMRRRPSRPVVGTAPELTRLRLPLHNESHMRGLGVNQFSD